MMPLSRLLRRLRRDQRGAALVEAALVLPLLIGLFLGISEFGEALTVNRRVEAAAGTGADLVARVRTITNADLAQIKPMLDEMIEPFPTETLGLVITSVVADADNNTTVAWSYAEGTGPRRAAWIERRAAFRPDGSGQKHHSRRGDLYLPLDACDAHRGRCSDACGGLCKAAAFDRCREDGIVNLAHWFRPYSSAQAGLMLNE